MSQYLITDEKGDGHLPVRKSADGPLDHGLMGAAHAALLSPAGYRGNKYEGRGKEEAIAKLKALYKSEGMDWPEEGTGDRGQGTGKESASERHLAVLLSGPGRFVKNEGGKDFHRIPICVMGKWNKGGRGFSITADDMQQMVANFEKRKNDMVVIDYEHASEQPEVARGGPVPAAGWIHELSANGILSALVEWTPDAADLIKKGQYRFFSPSIDWGACDKESGEAQGATLTSGALTNHPFLEELPPLFMSDYGLGALTYSDRDRGQGTGDRGQQQPDGVRAADTSGYLDSTSNRVSVANGGKGAEKMSAEKHLELKKLSGGAHDGHHGVFDGSDQVGCITPKHMSDHLKACGMSDTTPGDGEGKDNPKVTASDVQLLTEHGAVLRSDRTLDFSEMQGLVVRGRAAEAGERAEAGRKLLFSAVKDGVLDQGVLLDLVKKNESSVSLSQLMELQDYDRLFCQAFSEGKIAPSERQFFYEAGWRDRVGFSTWAKAASPRIGLRPVGIGANENIPVDQEVDTETRRLMSEQKLTYGKALKALFRENPGLEARYHRAHSRNIPADQPAADHVMA